jgi:hypothetical protein
MSDHKQWCPAHPSRQDGRCACADVEDTRTLDLFAQACAGVVEQQQRAVAEAAEAQRGPCECPKDLPAWERCGARWIRCNARLAFERSRAAMPEELS